MKNKHTIKLQLTNDQIVKAIEYVIIARRLGHKTAKEYVLKSDEEHFLVELCNEIYINLLVERIDINEQF